MKYLWLYISNSMMLARYYLNFKSLGINFSIHDLDQGDRKL